MVDRITCEKIDAVNMKVTSDPSIRQELYDYFAFRPEGYQFNPRYKARMWDGYIRMYHPMKPYLKIGLLYYLQKFCDDRDYELVIDKALIPDNKITEQDILDLCKEIKTTMQPRDYQLRYIVDALNDNRSLSISPTASGKSFIIYLIQQYYYRNFNLKTLIIVPTVSLVHQMTGDFEGYGCDPKEIYKIKSGVDKNSDASVTVSTWQSIYKQDAEWFSQFGVILGDEAHLFSAKSLTTIMDQCYTTEYRHGFTGTISSESKINKLVLEGMFGKVRQYVTTKNLMDAGTVADFKVKALILTHSKEKRVEFSKAISKLDKAKRYHAEKEYLFAHEKRNEFLKNLIWSLKDQNNLILFDLVEKHGKVLQPILEREGSVLHFIHGGVSGEERERVRHLVEQDPIKRHNILASYGTLSTGYSLKRLDNIIFASGYKSEVKVLQSIGRLLRKGNGSDDTTLYDIVDDLTNGSFINYTMQHFIKRVEIYDSEEFQYKIININL